MAAAPPFPTPTGDAAPPSSESPTFPVPEPAAPVGAPAGPPPSDIAPAAHNEVHLEFPDAPTQPSHAAVAAQPEDDDERIAALRAMFPDFDVAILQMVLESVGGDQDRAIDSLLGMSDPSYVAQEAPTVPGDHTALDEQMARQLMLEEQEHARQRSNLQQQTHYQQQQTQYQQYHRQGRPAPEGASPQTSPNASPNAQWQGKDTVTELQEQFSKIADTGKKTFSSLFSKVKSKIQEFEASQAQGSTRPAQDQSQQQQPYNRAGPGSYFDPRFAAGPSGTLHQGNTPTIQLHGAPPAAPPPGPPPGAVGYDVGESYAPLTVQQPQPQYMTSADASPARARLSADMARVGAHAAPSSPPAPVRAVSPADAGTPRPPSTSTGPPTPSIDPGRIGLLPKRPVSLLRDSSTTVPSAGAAPPHHPDDDDELEYA